MDGSFGMNAKSHEWGDSMASSLSEFLFCAQEFLSSLTGTVRKKDGSLRFRPLTISEDESKAIAQQLKRFLAIACQLPLVWDQIQFRASFVNLESSTVVTKSDGNGKTSRYTAYTCDLSSSRPEDLLDDDCDGCRLLLEVVGMTGAELSRQYRRQSAATILNSIYTAVANLVPWAEQNLSVNSDPTALPAAPSPANKKRGRKPKFIDPDEEEIRQTYLNVGTIKGTIESMKLKKMGSVSALKRVERIVNRDRQRRSRAKN